MKMAGDWNKQLRSLGVAPVLIASAVAAAGDRRTIVPRLDQHAVPALRFEGTPRYCCFVGALLGVGDLCIAARCPRIMPGQAFG